MRLDVRACASTCARACACANPCASAGTCACAIICVCTRVRVHARVRVRACTRACACGIHAHTLTSTFVSVRVRARVAGRSAESYVLDFVHTSTQRKWTCVVLIARGLGGVALQSGLPFTGARTTDVAACIDVIAQAAPTTPIVGAGLPLSFAL
eukprot:5608281-Pleurochrysis_carterae.AAC.1